MDDKKPRSIEELGRGYDEANKKIMKAVNRQIWIKVVAMLIFIFVTVMSALDSGGCRTTGSQHSYECN